MKALDTEDASASPNVLDIKGRLMWHGQPLQLVLFDLGRPWWRRKMNTQPDRAKVGIAQARIIVRNLCDRLYSADGLAYQHDKHNLGWKVPLTGELIFEVEKLIKNYLPEGRTYTKADIDVDLSVAQKELREINARNQKQRKLDFGEKQKKAKAS